MAARRNENLFGEEELDKIFEKDDVENFVSRREFNEEELDTKGRTKDGKKAKRPKTEKQQKLIKLITIIILGLALISAIAYFASNLFGNKPKTSFENYNTTLQELSNGKISVIFYLAEIEDDISEFEEEEGYVYIKLYYRIENITNRKLSWQDMPYMSICKYTYDGESYNLVEGSEQEFDLEALKSYSLVIGIDYSDIKEDLEPHRQPPRYGADIIKIPADEFDFDSYFVTIDNIDAIVKINDPSSIRKLELFRDDDNSDDTSADDSQTDDE